MGEVMWAALLECQVSPQPRRIWTPKKNENRYMEVQHAGAHRREVTWAARCWSARSHFVSVNHVEALQSCVAECRHPTSFKDCVVASCLDAPMEASKQSYNISNVKVSLQLEDALEEYRTGEGGPAGRRLANHRRGARCGAAAQRAAVQPADHGACASGPRGGRRSHCAQRHGGRRRRTGPGDLVGFYGSRVARVFKSTAGARTLSSLPGTTGNVLVSGSALFRHCQ